jgi:hypothetical protein
MAARPLVALLFVTLAGCVVANVRPGTARIPGPVGSVEVTIVPEVSPERIERYRELEGNRIIREAIEHDLASVGMWQPDADVRVRVTVTEFALRSTANAFFSGFLAGDDELSGRIAVDRPAAASQEIAFSFSGNEEVYFVFPSGGRFRALVNALAHAIRARLDASSRDFDGHDLAPAHGHRSVAQVPRV